MIILIGLSEEQILKVEKYPNIVGLSKTNNTKELVFFYSIADVVLNLSYEETFGLTTVEGMACGTPCILYNSTASPELVDSKTGYIVEPGDIDGVKVAIEDLMAKGNSFFYNPCLKRVQDLFGAYDRYKDYVELYNKLYNE